MDSSQKQSIIDRLKQANNVLVTVSSNPSVDQLSACIGLTLMLNELNKHATAVFSGIVPPTLEFLQPEKTLERDTDSLRDFIIALDKSKADKLRYKVEDKVVKIFITPYRTSISDKDLQFSQGDFNVDVVVCLGVKDQRDLDQAITSHGRILHDATVISINTVAGSTLGTLNWQNAQASSLSEMIASLSAGFDKNLLDTQIATALLTGVVAETDRFSNDKTSPETMKVSAQLMAAGANQQLVATKLAEPPAPVELPREVTPQQINDMTPLPPPPPKPDDGTLHITHDLDEFTLPPPAEPPVEEVTQPEEALPQEPQIQIDKTGQLHQMDVEDRQFLAGPGPSIGPAILPQPDGGEKPSSETSPGLPDFALNQPMFGGTLTANSRPEELDPATDPLSQPPNDNSQPMLTHNSGAAIPEAPAPREPKVIQPPQPVAPAGNDEGASSDDKTSTEVKTAVDSPAQPDESGARDAVEDAIREAAETPPPKPHDDSSITPPSEEVHDSQSEGKQPAKDSSDKDKDKKPEGAVKATNPLGSLVEPLSAPVNEPAPAAASPSARPLDMPLPQPPAPLTGEAAPSSAPSSNGAPGMPQGPPPPVPPPIVPQFGPNNS